MSNNQLVELIREMEQYCNEHGFVWDVEGIADKVKERLTEEQPSHLVFQDAGGKKELVRL